MASEKEVRHFRTNSRQLARRSQLSRTKRSFKRALKGKLFVCSYFVDHHNAVLMILDGGVSTCLKC